jgi:hypothetical protein
MYVLTIIFFVKHSWYILLIEYLHGKTKLNLIVYLEKTINLKNAKSEK